MAKYAERTTVSPEQRRGEIERTLARYGATAFGYATSGDRAQVVFEMNGRQMRLDVTSPDRQDKKFTHLESSPWVRRSEEHTSELQSRQYLVCRLLPEKKKSKQVTGTTYVSDAAC